ncbi:MAG: gliding motility-associated ABC transporter ATP-binding subunit GldA [Bacteroidales bacterium]|nr:gliding motility-associated ABC transporter ATP-binding subunit GldA [Bacteroidales bacterium]
MSISVKNISKLYGKQKALDNISLEVKTGEIVGLLGPNGAGKSTMMKIITCFIPPTSGDVFVNDFDIYEQAIEVRKCIGYLPENNPLYLEMYVREYLSFIAGIHKLGKKTSSQIDKMIEMCGLELEYKKKIGALSKGYRQRVGLAQALIHDPDVLILDEPTSGLDPNQLLEIRSLIKNIGKEKTIMLSTHIMQEVEAICDRAIIINNGKIVADDFTKNLSKIHSGKEIISVEFDADISENKLREIDEISSLKKVNKNTWIIETKSGKDIRSDIFEFAVKNNIKVLSMNKETKSIEEIFQQLTGK